MKLRYIHSQLKDRKYRSEISAAYQYHSNFLEHYLSIQVRKLHFTTDGTFNQILVLLMKEMPHEECRVEEVKTLSVYLDTFDESAYERMDDIAKYEYYLKLLEDGYRIAAKYKDIPLEDLLNMHQKFRDGGYKNEWCHKKKFLKAYGVDALLNCYMTSKSFRLELCLQNHKTKDKIICGDLLDVLPFETFFANEYRDIIVDGEFLYVTDFLDKNKYKVNIPQLLSGVFKFEDLDLDCEI